MNLKEQVLAGIVRCRLSEDMRTGGQLIDVRVAGRDIFLHGIVDNETQKQTAEVIVRGIVGVRDVVDRIKVRDQAGA